MMHLVQILLPLYDNRGDAFNPELYAAVRVELTERFGGVTAYARAPARGMWKDDDGSVARDDVVVYEVMVDQLDEAWWAAQRERLRTRFDQDELIVRSLPCQRL
jgi:hypothetical protein